MTTDPARRKLQPVVKPGAKLTRVERWEKRWREFGDLLLLPPDDAKKFGELMRDLAEDFEAGGVEEGPFYDRMREATDLLPMKRKDAVNFASKIYKLLQDTMTGDDE